MTKIVMTNFALFDRMIKIAPIKWQRVLEDARVTQSLFNKVLLVILDGLSKEVCVATYLVAKRLLKLRRDSGFLYVALYCKQASSCLQQYYGGTKHTAQLLPVPVSLTRSGLPRIIPPFHRKMISKRDQKADTLVQVYMSLFSVSMVLPVAKKVTSKTLSSITEPSDLDAVQSIVSLFKLTMPDLLRRYLPDVSNIALHQGLVWKPTWKAIPSYPLWTRGLRMRLWYGKSKSDIPKDDSLRLQELGRMRSSFTSQFLELIAFQFLSEFIAKYGEQWLPGALWPSRTRFAFDTNNKIFTGTDLDWFEKNVGPYLPASRVYLPKGTAPLLGRLVASLTGGGKRRIFAIGNYINQRLLEPVHDWLMKVLRTIPMDGTFDQTKPLDRLVGERAVYSFDLTAATDRWPLLVLFELMVHLFDRSFASSVVNSALAMNLFKVQFVKRHAEVSFIAGQPLGYYSSWPLFALSHHLVVWWCAQQAHPGIYFDRYAVLGDDVVIADKAVAAIYEQVLPQLGVKISTQKSLISSTGCAEFAKRFRIRNMSKDISPVSIRALISFHHIFGLMAISERYPCRRLSTLARIGGFGYKARSFISDKSPSKRVRRLLAMHNKRLLDSDFELWLGRGRLLNPSLRAHLIWFLRREMRPKQLKLPPDELWLNEDRKVFCEITMVRQWTKDWLQYVLWYWQQAMDPDVSLIAFKSAPIITLHFHVTRQDEDLKRFGLWWKLFDMVLDLGLDYSVPTLPSSFPDYTGMLLGGYSGNAFLVSPLGLVQPRARAGCIAVGVAYDSQTAVGNPSYTTIKYKTLGVSDRQSTVDFDRVPIRKKKHAVIKY